MPTNREHIDKVLLSLNLDSKERFNLLLISHGTSLNDTYWIKDKDARTYNPRYATKKGMEND